MFALLVIVFLVTLQFAIDAATSDRLAALATPAVLIAGFLVYFAPTIAAGQRGHLSANAIFIVNLFFGWTLLGLAHRADLGAHVRRSPSRPCPAPQAGSAGRLLNRALQIRRYVVRCTIADLSSSALWTQPRVISHGEITRASARSSARQ
jgi:Superinfection immunity protein